jgi:HlyD family secretion protein
MHKILLVKQAKALKSDIVLIDVGMPEMKGINATHKIDQQLPQAKVFVLNSHQHSQYVVQALKAGAKVYVLKNNLAEGSVQPIWLVCRDPSQIKPELLKEILAGIVLPQSIVSAKQRDSILVENLVEKQPVETALELRKEVNQASLITIDSTENKHKPQQKQGRSLKSLLWWIEKAVIVRSQLAWLAIVATLISGGIICYIFFRFREQPPIAPSQPSINMATQPTINMATQPIVSLGYLEPDQDGAIEVTGDSTGNRVIVDKLFVKQGDYVKPGQVIATLSTRKTQQAAVKTAKTQVEIAQAKLAQVQTGAKQGDIQAQAAMVASAESKLINTKTEYQRYDSLYQQGVVSLEERDSRRLQLETAEASLRQQQEQLRSLAEIRPEDLQAAKAELNNAVAGLNEAKANLDLTFVRAPREGEIIQINTYPGELIGDSGILKLGQTNQMYVSAEIYQSDINRVKLSQQAKITGDAFKGELLGTVSKIGREVASQNVEDSDPLANVDARVIEVKIRLNQADSKKVAGLTNLQVKVKIIP